MFWVGHAITHVHTLWGQPDSKGKARISESGTRMLFNDYKNIWIQIHKNVGSLVSRASRQYEDSRTVIF